MATNTSTLLRNPTNIGDIFFSGSQSVFKGLSVSWILDDTWAFKTTEECAVSMNATPFVTMNSGQTFIIEKGAKYIFDRDTVVALAYPQDVTQDIIIPNNIYNNNLPTIIIEADKNPVAKITSTHSAVDVGDPVGLSAATSYSPDNPPAEPLTYRWIINGVEESLLEAFVYTPTTAGIKDILLVVTDTQDRKADASYNLAVSEKTYDQNTYVDDSQWVGSVPMETWTPIFSLVTDVGTTNAENIVNFSADFGQVWKSDGTYLPASVTLRFMVGTDELFNRVYTNTQTSYQVPLSIVDGITFDREILVGEEVKIEAWWNDTGEGIQGVSSVCNFCANGDFQMVSTEQPI